MADPRAFSEDSDIQLPWDGDEKFPVIRDDNSSPATYLNFLARITDIQTLVNLQTADLPASPAAAHGRMAFVTNGLNGGSVLAIYDDSLHQWLAIAPTYDFGLFIPGTPDPTIDVLQKVPVLRKIFIPADFLGGVGHVKTSPDDPYAVEIRDDGVAIGTVTCSALGAFTFATTSNESKIVAAGSIITMHSPGGSPGELTMQDLAFTLPAFQVI